MSGWLILAIICGILLAPLLIALLAVCIRMFWVFLMVLLFFAFLICIGLVCIPLMIVVGIVCVIAALIHRVTK